MPPMIAPTIAASISAVAATPYIKLADTPSNGARAPADRIVRVTAAATSSASPAISQPLIEIRPNGSINETGLLFPYA